MRRWNRTWLAGLLALSLALPGVVRATSYEDSLYECDYPPIFDLTVMRPLGLLALAWGTMHFGVFFPFTVATAPKDIPLVASKWMGEPARFTFKRRLGQCAGVDAML